MVKIRLARVGRTHLPTYKIVVSDSRRTPASARLAELGHYDPNKDILVLDEEAALKWLSCGAKPSDSVKALFKKKGINAKFAEGKAKKAEDK